MQIPSSSEISDAVETKKPEIEFSSEGSMDSFYRLQAQLMRITIAFSVIVFVVTCFAYSWHVGLNYLLGACTGVVYLRMLSKNVEAIGRNSTRISSSRLALVAALILVASQWNQLEVMPVFLGFLTYKAALIGYTIWAVVPGDK